LYMNGDVAEALTTAEKVLETKPDNFHALANLVRFSVFLGREDEARKFAEILKKTESANPDLFVKKIEAFSFLGDDAAVVEEYEKSKNLINDFEIPQSYAKHLAAFAFYRTGEAKKAEKMWEEIIEDNIEFDYSEENLEQLDLPPPDRDVFGLPLAYWIPPVYLEKLFKATVKIKDGRNFDKNLQKTLTAFFDENPHILKVIPILLDRSDHNAKEFAVKLLDWAETPEALKLLEEFAFSQTGSDQIRYTAAMTLSRLDAVSNRVKMWQGGELKEMILMCFEITDEPTDIYPMKAKAHDFLGKGLIARQNGNLELAEQYFQKALDTNGEHPSLLYNLLAISQTRGTVEEANRELKRIVEKFPEYSFAAISLATNYARQGKTKAAKKLTEKFYDKKKWHFTEIRVWLYFNLEFSIAEKHFDSARNAMQMLERFDENFDKNYWEERITRLELIEKLAPLLEKAKAKKSRKKK
jgi:tetratricopeptide (TPR) repeat protein